MAQCWPINSRQVLPRPDVRGPARSAMLAHDASCGVAGVVAVLASFRLDDLGCKDNRTRTFRSGVTNLDEQRVRWSRSGVAPNPSAPNMNVF